MASATTLTFDLTGGTSDAGVMDQNYGDRVTSATTDATGAGTYAVGAEGATPNVLVEYLAEDALTWRNDYTGLTNVFYSDPASSDFLGIRFTADTGFLVNLLSFDISSYFGAAPTIDGISVTADGVSTSVSGAFTLSSTGPTSFAPNVSGTTVELMLDFASAGSLGHDIGIDNVLFSQSAAPIPLPAGAPLLLAGLGVFAWAKRRKS